MPTANPTPEFPGDKIEEFLRRFVIFTDDDHATILALWIIHTYAVEAAYTTPYIYVNSAEKQSGKTRLIETANVLAHNPIVSGNVSASSLFRLIETARPTIFIDEVDTIFHGASNEDLRSVLNSGYKSNGSVMRVVPGKDGGEVMHYSTFCPKLLAGIDNGQVPDTVADRCIPIILKRKKKDQEVERFMARKVEAEAEPIKAAIQAWVSHNMDKLVAAEPKPIPGIGDRAWDIAEPLVSIAERGKGWAPRARKALGNILKPQDKPLSLQAQVLHAAKTIMEDTGADKITSATLAEAMDMSAKRVGVLLNPYGITPRTIRMGAATAKGYYRRDFEDSWERYL